jgi:hypothetical protein
MLTSSILILTGRISALDRPTSFPILFTSNTIDPITPLKSYVLIQPSHCGLLYVSIIACTNELSPPRRARKMSSRFAGSVLLLQEAVGVSSSRSSRISSPPHPTKTHTQPTRLSMSIKVLTHRVHSSTPSFKTEHRIVTGDTFRRTYEASSQYRISRVRSSMYRL